MTPLPEGFALDLDRSVRTFRDGTVLVGGHPGRLITLTRGGVAALGALLADSPTTDGARLLGRRLVEAGMAHPRPMRSSDAPIEATDVTVVVPVHNRARALERCLASLGTALPVLVVDDASEEADEIARVCERHGARLIRRRVNGGPAAARNTALETVTTDLIAFLDSDCRVTDGWLEGLVWLFDDPEVAAVAPRVRPDRPVPETSQPLARFADAHCALDMGPDPSDVAPRRAVRYVPSAALVVRREALTAGFDSDLRVGEDVDLVWRLVEEGWGVRYEPSVTVFHEEPPTWRKTFARHFRYGTSAGALAQRHPGRLPPVELRPLPTVIALAALSDRRSTALAVTLASIAITSAQVRGRDIPLRHLALWNVEATGWTVLGLGRAATMLAGPALGWAVLRGRRARSAAVVLLLAPPLVEWYRCRPGLDPVRWTLASLADDISYGSGVWVGCLRSRTVGPLLPRIHRAASTQ